MPMTMPGAVRHGIALSLCWAALAGVVAFAHDLGQSESAVTVREAEVRARVTLDLLEIAGIDVNGDGLVSFGELDEGIDRIYAIIKTHLVIQSVAPPVRTTLERYEVRDDHVGRLDLLFTFDRTVSHIRVASTLDRALRPTHEHLTTVAFDGIDGVRRAALTASMPEATFAGRSPSYPATVVLALLAGVAIGCGAMVQFVRRIWVR